MRTSPTPQPDGGTAAPAVSTDPPVGGFAAEKEAFAQAAAWFVAVVGRVGGRWESPGLGEWDVRALVGHTSRSLLTVEAYLAAPAPAVEVDSAAEYLVATSAIAAGPAVSERGRAAGAALGAGPAAEVAAVAARVVPLVAACDGSELLTTIAGGMRLADYLPTRTFELVVHTADLAAALGVGADVPPLPAAHALALVGQVAAATGRAAPLLLAATGRRPLPAGYTVL